MRSLTARQGPRRRELHLRDCRRQRRGRHSVWCVSALACRAGVRADHAAAADGLLVDQAVSVVGICTFCGPDDIEVSPQLMGELTGSPDALTQPLPGAYVVQFNGNGDE
jgi:hypothetical protein